VDYQPFITAALGFASGYACRWLLDRRSERRQLVKPVVERYTALPEPRAGASASLERLALLQRSGAGVLTERELATAAAMIRQFGRADPLATDLPFSAFELLRQASTSGHSLGSAHETYDWIVSVTQRPNQSLELTPRTLASRRAGRRDAHI